MKKSVLLYLILLLLIVPGVYAQTSRDCSSLPSRLQPRHHGTTLVTLQVHDQPDPNSSVQGTLDAGTLFQANPDVQPQCVNGVLWWQITDGINIWNGWIPETSNGQYVIEPYVFHPEPPVPFDVPLTQPQTTRFNFALPMVTPLPAPTTLSGQFAQWDWATFITDSYMQSPDPLVLKLPDKYTGDLPVPPVDLSKVYFVKDANLNADQLKLLAQNGFVVVPSTYHQFDELYQSMDWDNTTGKAAFVTTDALLHSLSLCYQNALMFLETNAFYGDVADFLMKGYQAAEAQYKQAVGTALEQPARNAAVYYLVPLMLIADGENSYVKGYDQTPVYGAGVTSPSDVIKAADPSLVAEAQPLVDLAKAAQGREKVSILENYTEDFSQYKPRSYYAGNPLLEPYFRAMMWLGRIPFLLKSDADTLTGLLVMRALENSSAADSWQKVADTLDFLIGPTDSYSPTDYLPIATEVYGSDLNFSSSLTDQSLATFKAHVKAQLPPSKINTVPIPAGSITQEQLEEDTRGFRLFGQRFTFDGYIMQQLIYPAIGTADHSRTLPLGLDVPAVFGSDMAYSLTDAAGATSYAKYTDHVANLRNEINGIDGNGWLQNLYSGWLWSLQPLAVRDPAQVPPMMQTDAWQRKDLSTFLGSFTELKHATLLYAAQPTGGLGGGGMEPPVISYGYVEPNPQVFARIAIVAALMNQGLAARGFDDRDSGGLPATMDALKQVAALSGMLAEMARKEVAGEPLSYAEAYFLQEGFGNELWYIRYNIEQWLTNPPQTTALVADIASNAASGQALELGIANPDLIYVITNSPYGLQLTRGAVYSDYEFTVAIDQRMTDDEWRQQVANGQMPPRPDWIELYFSP